jgi:hypothetical protein
MLLHVVNLGLIPFDRRITYRAPFALPKEQDLTLQFTKLTCGIFELKRPHKFEHFF